MKKNFKSNPMMFLLILLIIIILLFASGFLNFSLSPAPNDDNTTDDPYLDSDGDGFTDLDEIEQGTDPFDPNDFPIDDPTNDYTCGDPGDVLCGGTCPEGYECWEFVNYDQNYWYCGCMTTDGSDQIHPDWQVGGSEHNVGDYFQPTLNWDECPDFCRNNDFDTGYTTTHGDPCVGVDYPDEECCCMDFQPGAEFIDDNENFPGEWCYDSDGGFTWDEKGFCMSSGQEGQANFDECGEFSGGDQMEAYCVNEPWGLWCSNSIGYCSDRVPGPTQCLDGRCT